MKQFSEEQIKNMMDYLELTREEAIQVLQDDFDDVIGEEGEEMEKKSKEIVKGEKRGRKPRAKGEGVAGVSLQKRAKKENPTKLNIIAKIYEAIQQLEGIENPSNPNPEKTILFELGGNTYEIDLKQKRKPKES